MAAEGTKPQGSAADEHNSRENAKAAGVKAERNRRYGNNECFGCGKQGYKQWHCPQSQQGKAGKGVRGQSHGTDPHTAAAVHKRSRSAYTEQDSWDGPCVCHPSS